MYQAAPDGGLGPFMALTTSADSFRAVAASGRAGSTAMSRPAFSSARPPGQASHPGAADVTAGRTAPADVAGSRAAPVPPAMATAPPKIAAALTDVRCHLKVLLLALLTNWTNDAYVTSEAAVYFIPATAVTSHLWHFIGT